MAGDDNPRMNRPRLIELVVSAAVALAAGSGGAVGGAALVEYKIETNARAIAELQRAEKEHAERYGHPDLSRDVAINQTKVERVETTLTTMEGIQREILSELVRLQERLPQRVP